jgi:hypothetical protein
MLATMLVAWEAYGDRRFLDSARHCGDFLILAQMPDPQPAWAQQYNERMHPVWDRKFEPPAISGWESQSVMEALMLLYRSTGEEKYLDPIPRALAYLRKSQLEEGKLARFYELQTNRPLYFKVTDNRYNLTYNPDDLPTHYGFIMDSRLDRIEAEYNALRKQGRDAPPANLKPANELAAEVRTVIDSLDDRGAWIDKRGMRGYRKASPEGVIQSETFIRNVELLCEFLGRSR